MSSRVLSSIPKFSAFEKNNTLEGLVGSYAELVISEIYESYKGIVLYLVNSTLEGQESFSNLKFFNPAIEVELFPDWEILPYDRLSPHVKIVSQRIATLNRLVRFKKGVIILPVKAALYKLPPREWVTQNTFDVKAGGETEIKDLRLKLLSLGYVEKRQVFDVGNVAFRGSVVDIYPIGSSHPVRLDFFDNRIDSIRQFDAETQRSTDEISIATILPAKEYPSNDSSLIKFKRNWRLAFGHENTDSPFYHSLAAQIIPAGIEHYLSFFYDKLEEFYQYIKDPFITVYSKNVFDREADFKEQTQTRYHELTSLNERPILQKNKILTSINSFEKHSLKNFYLDNGVNRDGSDKNSNLFKLESHKNISLATPAGANDPFLFISKILDGVIGKVLFVVSSDSIQKGVIESLNTREIDIFAFRNFHDFLRSDQKIGIVLGGLSSGFRINNLITVITESEFFKESSSGKKFKKEKRRKRREDIELILRNLSELELGDPVVHEDYGVGRYNGFQTLTAGGVAEEFIRILYADDDVLYLPVRNVELMNRYSSSLGGSAPLHKLGSGQWEKICRKAKKKVRDVAVEILENQARREVEKSNTVTVDEDAYAQFVQEFPYTETADQAKAIGAVIEDLCAQRPMDRLICGDVGFGKTEIAMRAAFLAVNSGYQVAVLVPTTILASQHFETFKSRFSNWPIKIALLSRLSKPREININVLDLESGKIDIVIGTQKLLSKKVAFKNLGLLVVDEEHRFGVSQKEKIKSLKANVDLLTLTATPIPRTLNIALSGMKDLSLIASPPADRLAIQTYVSEWSVEIIKETILRELGRGGQVYFVHNEVKTIQTIKAELNSILPEAKIGIAHGKLKEGEISSVMNRFYRGEYNILLCTTIIESGIDMPKANTIIINRADKMGLAQLYQLRGRIGRSDRAAYAYFFTPNKKSMTKDAIKRLEAIESLNELGMGFMLANHDLEIRGAGEILGEEQSGEIQEIGFLMFNELLEKTIKTLKNNSEDALKPESRVEVDLREPAFFPEHYLPDVHLRLVLYKRIAGVSSDKELSELRAEILDRYGQFEPQVENIFYVASSKIIMREIGVVRADIRDNYGRLEFSNQTKVLPETILAFVKSYPYYKMEGPNILSFLKELKTCADKFSELQFIVRELIT